MRYKTTTRHELPEEISLSICAVGRWNGAGIDSKSAFPKPVPESGGAFGFLRNTLFENIF